jgi:hypothetical protein
MQPIRQVNQEKEASILASSLFRGQEKTLTAYTEYGCLNSKLRLQWQPTLAN